MNILSMTNEHPDFYRYAGPFLSRREIVKEMGGPVWDEDGKLWFFAVHNELVLGFATMTIKDTLAVFDEAYIQPEYRHQGLHADLIDARLAHCPKGTTIQTLIFNKSLDEYLKRGFTVKRVVGKTYTEVTRKVESNG